MCVSCELLWKLVLETNKVLSFFFFDLVLDFFLFELTDVSHLEDDEAVTAAATAEAAAAVDDDDDSAAVCKLFEDDV